MSDNKKLLKGTGPAGMGKQMKGASLQAKNSNEDQGFLADEPQEPKNVPPIPAGYTPPLELSEKEKLDLLAKEGDKERKKAEIKSHIQHFVNGSNEWKLISKTWNDFLEFEHTTMAMKVGTRGIIVHIKEKLGNIVSSTSLFISGGKMREVDKKWEIY